MDKEQPEKMDGNSLDIPAENRVRLKQLFPTVFTETRNDKGELAESIDFEKLKAELGTFSDLFESRRERYGMDWPGKKDALRIIQTPSTATLKPCREESVNFDTTENLFIEGENLEVLKLLQKSYYGKVKMIYIDPPYNTGKEFIYPDNFSESLATYLEYAGLIGGDGKKFSTNTANEGRFHTKWLNMMYPRLYLARNLLREDGVIFISIDDNEVSNLRKLCDEIFGEENFIVNMVWQSRTSISDDHEVSPNHNHILIYAKDKVTIDFYGLPLNENDYSNPDNDIRGKWKLVPIDANKPGGNTKYAIKNPKTGIEYWPPKGRSWAINPEEYERLSKEGRIKFGLNENSSPKKKLYWDERIEKGDTQTPSSIIVDAGTTKDGTNEIAELFGLKKIFDYPKPTKIIQRFLTFGCSRNIENIILDFFTGSATTAHAVLDLNKQDGGNRKFILVQLPEPCAEDSEAFKAGYRTIADIGKERIRRVIKKIVDEQESNLDFDPSKTQDRGFKVFKLNTSNFRQWQKLDPSTSPEEIAKELDLYIDHINHEATQEDLLYEILLKAGFTLAEKVEIKIIAGKNVFSVADGAFLLCLENIITKELIDAIAETEPMQFICLDSAFEGNDQLKANAVQTFVARNMQREKHNQIIFKTV